MTSVTIEYFAQLREQAGHGREVVDSTAASLSALYDELKQRHGFRLPTTQLRVAVDAAFADWQQPLTEGSVVVFIPPVAGG